MAEHPIKLVSIARTRPLPFDALDAFWSFGVLLALFHTFPIRATIAVVYCTWDEAGRVLLYKVLTLTTFNFHLPAFFAASTGPTSVNHSVFS